MSKNTKRPRPTRDQGRKTRKNRKQNYLLLGFFTGFLTARCAGVVIGTVVGSPTCVVTLVTCFATTGSSS
jgi:hypothetical protein